jgi:hypothetical protein
MPTYLLASLGKVLANCQEVRLVAEPEPEPETRASIRLFLTIALQGAYISLEIR